MLNCHIKIVNIHIIIITFLVTAVFLLRNIVFLHQHQHITVEHRNIVALDDVIMFIVQFLIIYYTLAIRHISSCAPEFT